MFFLFDIKLTIKTSIRQQAGIILHIISQQHVQRTRTVINRVPVQSHFNDRQQHWVEREMYIT